MAQAVLYVELVPTTTGIKRNVEKELNGSFDTVDKKGSSVFQKIGGFAKGAALAAAGAAATLTGIAVKGGFSRMLKIEDAQAKLAGLGHDTQVVEAIMTSALAAVKGTAYGLDTAATVAASAVAAGIKPGQELENYLRLTADAATIAGISMDEMGSIMNKVNANGKAMTENLNQLQDRGIPILQYLAEEYGVSTQEMSKMVSQGKVDAATFNRVLQENLGGAALKSGETTRGAFANMLAALSRTGVALIENVFPYFKDMFNGITGLLDTTTDNIKPFGDAAMALIGLLGSGDFTSGIRELTGLTEDSPVVDFLLTARELALELAGGFQAMFKAFTIGDGDVTSSGLAGFMEQMGNAARSLWDAFAPLLPQIIDLWASFSPLGLILGALGPVLGELANTLAGVLGGAISTIMPTVIALAEMFGGLLADALPMLIPLIAELGVFVGDLAAALIPLVGTILSALMPVFQALVPVILAIVGAVLPLVTIILGALMPVVQSLAGVIGVLLTAIAPLVTILAQALAPIIGVVADVLAAVLVPVLDVIVAIVTVVVDIFADLVDGLTTGSGEAGGAFQVLSDIVGGVGEVIMAVINGIGAVFTWLYETIIMPVFNAIAAVVTWWWTSIVDPIFKLVMLGVGLMAMAFQFAYDTFIKPALDAIGAALMWVYQAVIMPVAGFIGAIINGVGAIFSWLYTVAIKPAIDGIGAIFSWVWNSIISPVANFITTAVNLVGSVIGTVFGTVGDVIKGAFNGVVDFVKGIFNTIIGLVNGVIDGINAVAGVVGGAIGIDLTLSRLPLLANGALVETSIGGSAAIIGEGRYDEAVIPLGGPQLEKIRDALNGGRGGGRRAPVQVDQHFTQQDPVLAQRAAGREIARQFASQ